MKVRQRVRRAARAHYDNSDTARLLRSRANRAQLKRSVMQLHQNFHLSAPCAGEGWAAALPLWEDNGRCPS